MNLVKNKHGRGEEGQQAMNSEFAVPHSALSSQPSCVSWNGTIDLSEKDQAVVFGFYCLVFLLPLNVLQQLLLLETRSVLAFEENRKPFDSEKNILFKIMFFECRKQSIATYLFI